MPDNSDSTPTRSLGRRGGRRQSLAPREAVLGLDNLERGISLFGAGIALVLALVTAIEWARNLPVITTVKHVAGKACPAAYPKHVKSLCELVTTTSRSQWEIKFFFILLIAMCLLYFTLRRKRAGVACFAIFLGLGLGIDSGLVFFFLGAWLIVRAYRLQKYGVPNMLASNRVARDMATARKEGRTYTPESATTSATSSKSTPTKPTTPEASKRYTPKKPPRRRRS